MRRDEEVFTYIMKNYDYLGRGMRRNEEATFVRYKEVIMYSNQENGDYISVACESDSPIKYWRNSFDFYLFHNLVDMADYLEMCKRYQVETEDMIDLGVFEYYQRLEARTQKNQKRLEEEASKLNIQDMIPKNRIAYQADVIWIDDEKYENDAIDYAVLERVYHKVCQLDYERIEITNHNYMEYKGRKLKASDSSLVLFHDPAGFAVYYFNGEKLNAGAFYENRQNVASQENFVDITVKYRHTELEGQCVLVSGGATLKAYLDLLKGKNPENVSYNNGYISITYFSNKAKYNELAAKRGEFRS